MLRIDPNLMQQLYGKRYIAYGTGEVGKFIIPYLQHDPNICLLGVTSSKVAADESGTFMDTELPLRGLSFWAETEPDAAILVTTAGDDSLREIMAICENVGFTDCIQIPRRLLYAVEHASSNLSAIQQSVFYEPEGMYTEHNETKWAAVTANPMLQVACLANEIRDLHKETFSEFKACHRGQTVAVIGCGPTLNYYTQIKGVPHIGVNYSFKKKGISLDYFFASDRGNEPWYQNLKNYDCVKFFCQYPSDRFRQYIQIPEHVVEENHGRRYFKAITSKEIHLNIEYYPLMGFHSVIFPAINFALYTRAKRILLVGCDCTDTVHFDGSTVGNAIIRKNAGYSFSNDLPKAYEQIRIFVESCCPDTEIVSVNPVGLKGMFHDVYTESYLKEHPEVKSERCEMLDALYPDL